MATTKPKGTDTRELRHDMWIHARRLRVLAYAIDGVAYGETDKPDDMTAREFYATYAEMLEESSAKLCRLAKALSYDTVGRLEVVSGPLAPKPDKAQAKANRAMRKERRAPGASKSDEAWLRREIDKIDDGPGRGHEQEDQRG